VALVQLIVDETNKYAQQEISRIVSHFKFSSSISKWEDVTVDKMYIVLAHLMLIGTVQKTALRSFYSNSWLLFTLIPFVRIYLWKD
jgi:hypothetical protein